MRSRWQATRKSARGVALRFAEWARRNPKMEGAGDYLEVLVHVAIVKGQRRALAADKRKRERGGR